METKSKSEVRDTDPAYHRQYRQKHRARISAQKKEYYQRNKEKIRERSKDYYWKVVKPAILEP